MTMLPSITTWTIAGRKHIPPPPTDSPLPWDIYTRASSKKQERHGHSHEDQEREGIECLTRLGLPIGNIIRETACSESVFTRPLFVAALDRILRNEIGGVCVRHRDRAGRNPDDRSLIILPFIRAKRLIEAADEDGAEVGVSADAVLNQRVRSAVDEHKLLRGRELTLAAMRAKIRRGEPVGAPPFGYRYPPSLIGERSSRGRPLEENPEEQIVVARIVALRVAGYDCRTVARMLHEEGVTGRGGKRWGKDGVSAVSRRAGIRKGVVTTITISQEDSNAHR